MFVCLLGSGKCRLIFNIKNKKKNKIILVGASLAPLKEPNAGIREILSPVKSASKKKKFAPSGNRTRLPCLVGTDSTTKPKVLIEIAIIYLY